MRCTLLLFIIRFT